MKMVWLYIMAAAFGGFIGALVPSLFRVDSVGGTDWLVTTLWALSLVLLVISTIALAKAKTLGEQEDDIKRHEAELSIEEKEVEKRRRDMGPI